MTVKSRNGRDQMNSSAAFRMAARVRSDLAIRGAGFGSTRNRCGDCFISDIASDINDDLSRIHTGNHLCRSGSWYALLSPDLVALRELFVSQARRKAVAAIDEPGFRFHDLRHTWASWHGQSGTPLHALQRLGGWSSYEMVLRYAHLDR